MKIVAAVLYGVLIVTLSFLFGYAVGGLIDSMLSQAAPATVELVPVVRVFHL